MMDIRMTGPCGALGAAVLLIAAAAPAVTTIHVANNGLDQVKCGSETAPCRTIGRGIAAAPPGAVVAVQPGIYGDVDEDGVVAGTGEDEAAASATEMLLLDKPVTVKSTAGPAATVIRCPSSGARFVTIDGVAAAFGTKVNGFTLLGCTVLVDAGAGTASVSGNRLIASAPLSGIEVFSGVGVTIANNHCIGWAVGIDVAGTIDARLVGNVLAGNRVGIEAGGAGTQLLANVVVGNAIAGLILEGTINDAGEPLLVERNAVIGNATSANPLARGAIEIAFDPEQVAINGNNIFGNAAPAENCGILDLSGDDAVVLDATGNFWGAATGPGPNPADIPCPNGGVMDVSGFLVEPVKHRTKAMK
jgi:hypothetical protein